MINIIDDFLPKSLYDKIVEVITNDKFEWNYGTIVTKDKSAVSDLENHQIFHMIYKENYKSNYIDIFNFVFRELKAQSVLRAKINLTWRRDSNIKIGWHKDYSPVPKNDNGTKLLTAIIYLNDNDGGTCFDINDNEKFVSCKKNRAVIFDSNIEHCGVTCSKFKNKILLNVNYFPVNE